MSSRPLTSLLVVLFVGSLSSVAAGDDRSIVLDSTSPKPPSSTESSPPHATRERAAYDLAVNLYQKKLYQSAYRIFGEIADQPLHLRYHEALVWLGRLSMHLPESADIIERVGKYDDIEIEQARRNASESPLFYSELEYLLARYKYRNRDFEGAAHVFAKVDVRSPRYIKAQYWTGLANVQLRKSVRAVESFQRVVRALDARAAAHLLVTRTTTKAASSVEEEVGGGEIDEERMRDLAYLAMARTYYTAAIAADAGAIDRARLGLAIKYWNKIDPGGPFWLDALFEESWAHFMLGDYERALGNIHTLEAPYFTKAYYPEAGVLKAIIYFVNCHYGEAETLVARFQQQWQPYREDLIKLRDRFSQDANGDDGSDLAANAGYVLLKDIRDGRSIGAGVLTARQRKIAELSLGDRELSRYLQYAQIVDDEHRRIERMPPSTRDSRIAEDLKGGLLLAHDLAVQNAVELAKERIQRRLSELDAHLQDSRKLLIDISEARKLRAEVGETKKTDGVITAADALADDEHVLWPFTGEYWRDELGQYKQAITSKCGDPR